ncbi:hypothetical protein [Dokdonia sp.]|uniref:hypothetical protein n=1 Tax=Dokdonia sp. TaxID=2024995 RepID=UPI003264FAEF
MTFPQLLEKIQRNPSVDFGNVFSDAFNLYQKVWLQGLLLQLLGILVQYGMSMILYIPLLVLGFVAPDQPGEDLNGASIFILIVFVVMYLVMIVVLATFNFGLQAAFYRIVRMKDRNKKTEKGVNFGMFFKKKHLKKIFILSMAHIGISILAVMLCILPIFYVLIPLQFAIIIFAFYPDLSINDIYKAAFKLGNAKWGIAFGLMLVSGILAGLVGLLACVIGIYFTISFVYLPGYIIYKEVVGFYEDEDVIAQIGA